MLINVFDKAFAIAFYNSFLKIELNRGKENMITLNTAVFKRRC